MRRTLGKGMVQGAVGKSSNLCPSLPWWSTGYKSTLQCQGHRFNPLSPKIPHATKQVSPVPLPC